MWPVSKNWGSNDRQHLAIGWYRLGCFKINVNDWCWKLFCKTININALNVCQHTG